jgi:hypothetical protein
MEKENLEECQRIVHRGKGRKRGREALIKATQEHKIPHQIIIKSLLIMQTISHPK